MFPINGLNPPLYGLTETKGSGLSSKRPSRTPSWLSAYVKWGRRILRRATGPAHENQCDIKIIKNWNTKLNTLLNCALADTEACAWIARELL